MLKATAQKLRARVAIRDRIVLAALETLKEEGFAGTSARAIARRGGFNQALIFYHFGTLPDLLLAALDHTSEERLARYRSELAGAATLTALATRMAVLYEEDRSNRHITAVQELVAGSSSNPELGREIVARLEPWVEFAESVVQRLLEGTPFASILPVKDVAYVGIALYMGMETLTHLDDDRARVAQLFTTAKDLAPLLDLLRTGGAGGA